MEDDGVDLLAQLHKDEPVTEPELLHHDGNVAPIRRLRASTEDEVAGILGEDGDQPEAEEDSGPESQSNEPEPEEDIDLLIDHIDWQHAQGIVGLWDWS